MSWFRNFFNYTGTEPPVASHAYHSGNIGSGKVSTSKAFEYFQSSSTVSTVVENISEDVADIKIQLEDIANDELIESNDSRSQELFKILKDSNWFNLSQELMTDLLLTNSCFIEMRGNTASSPFDIMRLDPINITMSNNDNNSQQSVIRFSKTGKNKDWILDVESGKWLDPTDDLTELIFVSRGISQHDSLMPINPLSSIHSNILIEINGEDYNSNLLENGASVSGVLALESSTKQHSQATKEHLKQEFQGIKNAGEIKLLNTSGSAKFLSLTSSNRDMDYINLLGLAERKIVNKFRMPLPMIITDAMTLNNYENAALLYVRKAVLKPFGVLLNGLMPLLDRLELDNVVIVPNINSIEILQHNKVTTAKVLAETNVLSTNEIRHELGLPLADGGSAILAPASNIPVAIVDDDSDEFISPEPTPAVEDN